MHYIGIKTRVLQPPKDDLLSALDQSVLALKEGDVVLVSSKVVAIGEGRCVLEAEFDKEAYVRERADMIIDRPYWSTPLTLVNHVFVSSAGVDKSNGDGHYILLPLDPFASARRIHEYFKKKI